MKFRAVGNLNSKAKAPPGTDLDRALLVERHVAEFFRAEAAVPGAEVHVDPDITWVVQPGRVWSNAGILLRFDRQSVEDRLDTIIQRYRTEGRGMGFWVSPAATPANLPQLLRDRRFHCRKRFPAMLRSLSVKAFPRNAAAGLEIRLVDNASQFLAVPHPSIGPVTTPRRRHMLEHLRAMVSSQPRKTRAFVAWLDGQPVGASLLFSGSECCGLHDLSVLKPFRGQGIGATLLEHTCQEAFRQGAREMVLIATSDGERLYTRRGFNEVARFGYWYRSFQRER